MLCIDPIEGPRGLVSLANFWTPLGASRQVCFQVKMSFLKTKYIGLSDGVNFSLLNHFEHV